MAKTTNNKRLFIIFYTVLVLTLSSGLCGQGNAAGEKKDDRDAVLVKLQGSPKFVNTPNDVAIARMLLGVKNGSLGPALCASVIPQQYRVSLQHFMTRSREILHLIVQNHQMDLA